jgi:hypothetical protein
VRPDDPVAALERWRDHGADYRVLELSSARAVVELRTCHGEPVDRLESDDPRLVEYLRAQGGDRRDGG